MTSGLALREQFVLKHRASPLCRTARHLPVYLTLEPPRGYFVAVPGACGTRSASVLRRRRGVQCTTSAFPQKRRYLATDGRQRCRVSRNNLIFERPCIPTLRMPAALADLRFDSVPPRLLRRFYKLHGALRDRRFGQCRA